MKQELKLTALRLAMIAACIAIAWAFSGCRVVKVEREGEDVLRNAEGQLLTDSAGIVQKVDRGWKFYHNSHWLNTDADSLSASIGPDGTVSFSLSGLKSSPSEELTKLVKTSLAGAAELAAKVGAAVATSGGSVAGEAAASALQTAIANYIKRGGSVAGATVKCEGADCTITDGAVTETCSNCVDR